MIFKKGYLDYEPSLLFLSQAFRGHCDPDGIRHHCMSDHLSSSDWRVSNTATDRTNLMDRLHTLSSLYMEDEECLRDLLAVRHVERIILRDDVTMDVAIDTAIKEMTSL